MPSLQLYAIYFAVSFLIALLGRRRKLGFWGYFFATLLLTPLVGVLLLIASDKRPLPRSSRR